MELDEALAERTGSLAAGWAPDGRVVAMVPLIGGRLRLIRGSELTVSEFW